MASVNPGLSLATLKIRLPAEYSCRNVGQLDGTSLCCCKERLLSVQSLQLSTQLNQIWVRQERRSLLCIWIFRLQNYRTGLRLNLVLGSALTVATLHEAEAALTDFLSKVSEGLY
jgi:hypothetical protein